MGTTVDFKKKLIAKERESDSRDDGPETVRRDAGSPLGSPGGPPPAEPVGNRLVVFNGKEYAQVTAMPEDERRRFETVMGSIKVPGNARTREGAAREIQKGGGVTCSLDSHRKTNSDSPSWLSRWLLWGGIALLLVWGIYHFLL